MPIESGVSVSNMATSNRQSVIGNWKSILLFCCSLLFFVSCNSTDNSNATPVISGPPNTSLPMPPTKGASILNLGWEVADGKRSVFSEHKGKALILDFYATWCLPCRDSIPHLIGLQQKYENQGL